jgi:two-component system, LytTR family, response regulator
MTSNLMTRLRRPPSAVTLCLGGGVLLWLLYAFVFVQTTGDSVGNSLGNALANVLPLVVLAVATHAVLKTYVMPRTVPVQALLHALLAVGFATVWYSTVLVMLAFFTGVRGGGFSVSGFSGVAFTWQVFQGLIIYAGIAATCYALRGGREAAQVTIVEPPAGPALFDRYLIRKGDDILPIMVADIISIVGAQDYAEVSTRDGKHLVRLSLGEFEQRLDPAQFLRVHRSAIIQLAHLVRAEPAGGGRMLAHLSDGQEIAVSRAGVLALRPFIV